MTDNTNIFVYKNSIEPDLCERLIQLYKHHQDTPLLLTEVHSLGYNVKCNYIETKFFPNIDKELVKVVTKVVQKVVQDNPHFYCSEASRFVVREIYGETRCHIDSVLDPHHVGRARTLSMIIALNGDYEGGIFNFPLQNYKVKLEQGDAIIFPPTYTHPHEVSSPENGTLRYTITTWMLA